MTRWVARVGVRTRGDLVSWLLLLSMFAQAIVPAAGTPLRTAGGAFSAAAGDSALAAASSSAKKRAQLRAASDDGDASSYLGFDGETGLAVAAAGQSPTSAPRSSSWTPFADASRRPGLTPFAARAPPTL